MPLQAVFPGLVHYQVFVVPPCLKEESSLVKSSYVDYFLQLIFLKIVYDCLSFWFSYGIIHELEIMSVK